MDIDSPVQYLLCVSSLLPKRVGCDGVWGMRFGLAKKNEEKNWAEIIAHSRILNDDSVCRLRNVKMAFGGPFQNATSQDWFTLTI